MEAAGDFEMLRLCIYVPGVNCVVLAEVMECIGSGCVGQSMLLALSSLLSGAYCGAIWLLSQSPSQSPSVI